MTDHVIVTTDDLIATTDHGISWNPGYDNDVHYSESMILMEINLFDYCLHSFFENKNTYIY